MEDGLSTCFVCGNQNERKAASYPLSSTKIAQGVSPCAESQNDSVSVELRVKKYVAELIGTMVLTLVGCSVAVVGCSTPAGVVGTALAFGLSVVAMAYCIGRVS